MRSRSLPLKIPHPDNAFVKMVLRTILIEGLLRLSLRSFLAMTRNQRSATASLRENRRFFVAIYKQKKLQKFAMES